VQEIGEEAAPVADRPSDERAATAGAAPSGPATEAAAAGEAEEAGEEDAGEPEAAAEPETIDNGADEDDEKETRK